MATRFRIDAIQGEAALRALGARLAGCLERGDVLLLEGGLGAGKTTLARGIVQELTGESEVPSPTYTLVQTYEGGTGEEVWHADLYRLEAPEDVHPLGLLEVMDEVVSLIEWPERLGAWRPAHALTVEIGFDGDGRSVVLQPPAGAAGMEWRRRLEGAGFEND